ncbi:hypothetical protein C8R47DRAFT_708800 [Mycena vitilis]|nr:hypothetical protein C8R47DRAFT_708800 [Mycena vitilis]
MLFLSYALLTLSACTTRAALAPDISYAFNITNFQGHMVDLTDGNLQPLTPVQSYTPTNTSNQEWALISSQDARQLWEIVNLGSDSILSHTTAFLQLKDPARALHTQIVGSNQTLFWRMSFSSDGFARLMDADTGLALTAWPAVGNYPSSPVYASIVRRSFEADRRCSLPSNIRTPQTRDKPSGFIALEDGVCRRIVRAAERIRVPEAAMQLRGNGPAIR